jgi:hypothetical protein
MTDKEKPEVIFAPGCFDNFEGTQEELDQLVTEIKRMFESGEALENSRVVELDNMDPEEFGKLLPYLVEFDDDGDGLNIVDNRKLN